MSERYRAWTDGASRGNPGPASIGVTIEDGEGTEVATASERIGVTTNNVAEYRALLRALELLRELGADRCELRLDSQLIVKQMNGEYRVRDSKMRRLFDQVQTALRDFDAVRFVHVPRDENIRADELANAALDRVRPPRR